MRILFKQAQRLHETRAPRLSSRDKTAKIDFYVMLLKVPDVLYQRHERV
jgi:hypothetical protein